jgi:hypothetical protein
MTTSQIKEQVAEVVAQMATACVEYIKLAYDDAHDLKLGKPATAAQIAKVEQLLGKPLPPSYRAFLELHNGWAQYDFKASLLSAEELESDWVKEVLTEKGKLFLEFTDKNPLASGRFVVFAGQDSSRLGAFDLKKVGADGELGFVTYEHTKQEARFPSFLAFMKSELKSMQRLLQSEKDGSDDDDEEEDDDEDEDEDEDE